ncbi:MAG: hypothetical protein A2066_21235 [Bacteroidetes bacterium GWB2_41_8]|nr:MAG: hypothetical protein A2066_21235 [Bacteroidetes bacterium GWB2_41_8]
MLKLKNVPTYLEGKSFAKVVNDPSKPFRSYVEAVVSRGEMLGRMVKNEKWRYIEWDNGQKGSELYDQVNDPVEYNNLANRAEYAKVIQEMKKLMVQ